MEILQKNLEIFGFNYKKGQTHQGNLKDQKMEQ
jgi:hypothetical protein